jgi:hypothetical protein
MTGLISPVSNTLASVILSDTCDLNFTCNLHFKGAKVTKMRLYLRYRQIISTFDPPICEKLPVSYTK